MTVNNPFTEELIGWYSETKRNLPWRSTRDPYPIWLSEIILQQTRVDQGLPYWQRFMLAFPTVKDLANAEEEQVLRLWQGLGYYSRARNLHSAAKNIVNDFGGLFPSTYNEIIKLKGVGPYTAAAISSICFDEPKPVVDGNVYRFASRYFGIDEDITQAKTRKTFERLLDNYIDQKKPGTFNQAMMEFGATICSPAPKCQECCFRISCVARKEDRIPELPVKSKKTKIRDRYFHYLVLRHQEAFYLRQRQSNDVWANMYDFLLVEGHFSKEEVLRKLAVSIEQNAFQIVSITEPVKHILSHQHLYVSFYTIQLEATLDDQRASELGLELFSESDLVDLPKPKVVVTYFQQNGINT